MKIADVVSDWTSAYGIDVAKDVMWGDYENATYFCANPGVQSKEWPNYLKFIMHPNYPPIAGRNLILGIGTDGKFRQLTTDFSIARCQINRWQEATFAELAISGVAKMYTQVSQAELDIGSPPWVAYSELNKAKKLAQVLTQLAEPVVYLRGDKYQLTTDGSWAARCEGVNHRHATLYSGNLTEEKMNALKTTLEWMI